MNSTSDKRYINVIQRRLVVDNQYSAAAEPYFMIETHMSFEERETLFRWAMSLRDGFVACEIGSYFGASTCLLAVASKFRHGLVHAVDTWKNDEMAWETLGGDDTWETWWKNTEPLRQFIVPHRGEASTQASEVPDGLDLLFIDGDHSYPGVHQNLVDYGPKVAVDGLLVFHDFDDPRVRTACMDWMSPPTNNWKEFGLMQTLQVYKRLPDSPK